MKIVSLFFAALFFAALFFAALFFTSVFTSSSFAASSLQAVFSGCEPVEVMMAAAVAVQIQKIPRAATTTGPFAGLLLAR
jgi:hypothetical protein